MQRVDGRQNALAFWRIVFQQFQRCYTQEGCKNHHANNGRWICASQIGKRVFRHEREQQLWDAQVRHFACIVGFDRGQTRGLRCALDQTFSGQAKHIGHQYTDQRRDQRGEKQGANGQEADFTEL
ncbi:hypothetical protein D3C78_1474060 [compost metagenome]